jgi:hypothetical protein
MGYYAAMCFAILMYGPVYIPACQNHRYHLLTKVEQEYMDKYFLFQFLKKINLSSGRINTTCS